MLLIMTETYMQAHATAAFESFADHVLGIHLANAFLVWIAHTQLAVRIVAARVPAQVQSKLSNHLLANRSPLPEYILGQIVGQLIRE